MTPLLLPVFFVYAPKVSGGGGGAALEAVRTCAKTVMPVPAMPCPAAYVGTISFPLFLFLIKIA